MATNSATVELLIRAKDTTTAVLKRLRSQLAGVRDQLDALKQASRVLVGVGAALAASAFFPIKNAMAFEASMSRVKAIMTPTTDEFRKLRDIAKEMGERTQYTARQAADALTYLGMAGLSANEAIVALPGTLQLAAAGGMDLATAADYATNVLAGMNLPISELARVNDALAYAASNSNTSVVELADAMKIAGPAAAASGMEIEGVVAVLGGLANSGIKGANAGHQVKRMLIALQAPSNKAAGALKAMGVETHDALGRFRGLTTILEDLKDANMGMAEASAIFGRYASTAALATANQTDNIKELVDELDTAQGAAEQMAQTMLDNAQGGWTLFKSAVEGLTLALAGPLMQGIKVVLTALAKLAQLATKVINSLGPIGPALLAAAAILGTTAVVVGGMTFALTSLGQAFLFVGGRIPGVGTLISKFSLIAATAGGGLKGLQAALLTLAGGFKTLWLALGPVGWTVTTITALIGAWKAYQALTQEDYGANLDEIDRMNGLLAKQKNVLSKVTEAWEKSTGNEKKHERASANLARTLDKLAEGYGPVADAAEETRKQFDAASGAFRDGGEALNDLRTAMSIQELTNLAAELRNIEGLATEAAENKSWTQAARNVWGFAAAGTKALLSLDMGPLNAFKDRMDAMADERRTAEIEAQLERIKAAIQSAFDKGLINMDWTGEQMDYYLEDVMGVTGQVKEEWIKLFNEQKAAHAEAQNKMIAKETMTAGQMIDALHTTMAERQKTADAAQEAYDQTTAALATAKQGTGEYAEALFNNAQAALALTEAQEGAAGASEEYADGLDGAITKAQEFVDEAQSSYGEVVDAADEAYDDLIKAAEKSFKQQADKAKKLRDELTSIYDELAQMAMDREEKEARFRQKGMSDQQVYNDNKKRLADQLAKAEAALQAGNYEKFKEYQEKAISINDKMAGAIKKKNAEGKTEVIRGEKEMAAAALARYTEMQNRLEEVVRGEAARKEEQLKGTEEIMAKEQEHIDQLKSEKSIMLEVATQYTDDAKALIKFLEAGKSEFEATGKVTVDGEQLNALRAKLEDSKALVEDLNSEDSAIVIRTLVDEKFEETRQATENLKNNVERLTELGDVSLGVRFEGVETVLEHFNGVSQQVTFLNGTAVVIDTDDTHLDATEKTVGSIKDGLEHLTTTPVTMQVDTENATKKVEGLRHDLTAIAQQIAKDKQLKLQVPDMGRIKDDFRDLTRTETKKIIVKYVEQHAIGGPAGGYTPMSSGGRLPGTDSKVDKIPVLARPGEWFIRNEAVSAWTRRFGQAFMHAINSPWSSAGKKLMAALSGTQMSVGGMIGAIPAPVPKLAFATGGPVMSVGGRGSDPVNMGTLNLRIGDTEVPVQAPVDAIEQVQEAVRREKLVRRN